MRLLWNVLALIGLTTAVLLGVAGSSTASSTSQVASARALPSSCTVTQSSASSRDLWSRIETCGPCTVVVYDTAALRDRAVSGLAGLPSSSSWAVIGSNWITTGRVTPGDQVGAEICQFYLGGFVARLSG